MDAVELPRFRTVLARRPSIRQRLFSEAELAYADRRRDPTERLAARFAAKEAVVKAMGVGLWRFPYKDVEVVRARSGQPQVALHGKAATMAADLGITGWRLTITHTEETAFAIAVAL